MICLGTCCDITLLLPMWDCLQLPRNDIIPMGYCSQTITQEAIKTINNSHFYSLVLRPPAKTHDHTLIYVINNSHLYSLVLQPPAKTHDHILMCFIDKHRETKQIQQRKYIYKYWCHHILCINKIIALICKFTQPTHVQLFINTCTQITHVSLFIGTQITHVSLFIGIQTTHVSSLKSTQPTHVQSFKSTQNTHVCSFISTQNTHA